MTVTTRSKSLSSRIGKECSSLPDIPYSTSPLPHAAFRAALVSASLAGRGSFQSPTSSPTWGHNTGTRDTSTGSAVVHELRSYYNLRPRHRIRLVGPVTRSMTAQM